MTVVTNQPAQLVVTLSDEDVFHDSDAFASVPATSAAAAAESASSDQFVEKALKEALDSEELKQQTETQQPQHVATVLASIRTGVQEALGHLESAASKVESNPRVAEFEKKTEEALKNVMTTIKPHLDHVQAQAQPYVEDVKHNVSELYATAQPYIAQAHSQAVDAAHKAEPYLHQAAQNATAAAQAAQEHAAPYLQQAQMATVTALFRAKSYLQSQGIISSNAGSSSHS